jgi:hypothetical protein
MKFNLRKRNKYLLAGGLLLATATPSFAIFGLGDIVFDPTSYASLVSQLTTLDICPPSPERADPPTACRVDGRQREAGAARRRYGDVFLH